MPIDTDDEILIAKARKGGLGAFESLFRRFERPVYTLGMRICGRREDAEEVVQETFIEISRSLGKFRGDGPFRSWVQRIAATKALMLLRKSSRWEEHLSYDDGIVNGMGLPSSGSENIRMDLAGAFQRLSAAARAVLWLHDVEGYTHAEIAELTGKTPSYSKSQLARAHERLRNLLTAEDEVKSCIQP
ncbi:MAG: sigma-70 family RNA polymerase sigma factor [Acidobacteriota bacterium]|jgi:RNA polymerase sigma factor (sigma-70 family)